MRPKTTWILIADGARARIVVNEGPGKGIRQVEGADFRADHPPSSEMATDRPGRSFDSAGSGRHAMAPPSDPHRTAKQDFVTRLAGFLSDQLSEANFDRLIVVAPPQSLGDLRGALSGPVHSLISAELAKDLTHIPTEDLPEHLEEVLAV